MSVRTKGAFVGLIFLVMVLYVGVQLNFITYYGKFGIPFGKYDVENYLLSIKDTSYIGPNDMFIIHVSRDLSRFVKPEILLTWMIPAFLCIFLPVTVFMLAFWMSKDGTVALVSTVVYVFGTMSMQAFGISAMWSQMISTIFFVWSIIFAEEYYRTKSVLLRNIAMIMAAVSIFSHLRAAGVYIIYAAIRTNLIKGNFSRGIQIFAVIAAAIAYSSTLPANQYDVGLWYVFTNFMFPLLWILAMFGMIKAAFSKNTSLAAISSMVFVVMIISSFSVLWRPLLSVLPFLAVFATMEMFAVFDKYHPVVSMIIIVLLLVVLLAYSYNLLGAFLTAMHQEMIPGFYNETVRNINGTLFHSIWISGGKT